jgi:hypothetical protein
MKTAVGFKLTQYTNCPCVYRGNDPHASPRNEANFGLAGPTTDSDARQEPKACDTGSAEGDPALRYNEKLAQSIGRRIPRRADWGRNTDI